MHVFFSTANALIINTSEEYPVIKVITEAIKKLPAGFQDTTTGSLNAKKISKPSKASTGIVILLFQLRKSCTVYLAIVLN